MISADLKQEVIDWIKHDPDPKTAKQLQQWLDEDNHEKLTTSFNGFLQFGTAGLRGPIGPGPSCMNRAVVSRAASGIAAFMKKHNLKSVVIGRDARHGSVDFAKDSAEILAGAGFKTYVLPRELPTPVLAYAVNKLKADVGIMVTASHNPAIDNGYKVYLGGVVGGVNFHGSQIISPIDTEISDFISKAELVPNRITTYETVSETILTDYINSVATICHTPNQLKIVYTALHGVGAETFLKVFQKAGFAKPILVSEQEKPDPDFPTTPFPNPEESGAIDLALDYAKREHADLVIANDPDADRCAIAINDPEHGWRMLRGDEVGAIVGKYLIGKDRINNGAFANSLVSSSLLGKMARKAGIEFHETLTGFKWISKISNLTFGYEEALGYCIDPKLVNDKDGISVGLLIAQIAGELRDAGISLSDYLDLIGDEYGFHKTEQISIRVSDLSIISTLLNKFTSNPPTSLAGSSLISTEDLSRSKTMATPGIRCYYNDGIRIIIRPSGTEPKLKCYIEVVSGSRADAQLRCELIKKEVTTTLQK
ncbi:MAG: phospho-sugar mutase [Actinobacteria bacterium]|nr:phospho-sugar mutase [Actinomycetota bacterium]